MNVEQDIIDYIKTQLENIADVNEVTDGLQQPDEYSELPAISIVDLNTTNYSIQSAAIGQYVSGSGATNLDDGWPVSVVGYVKADTNESIQPKIRALQQKIVSTVLEDSSQGGNAEKTFLSHATKDVSKNKHNNIGSTVITFSIKYELKV